LSGKLFFSWKVFLPIEISIFGKKCFSRANGSKFICFRVCTKFAVDWRKNKKRSVFTHDLIIDNWPLG
jgi:hypothetical protein